MIGLSTGRRGRGAAPGWGGWLGLAAAPTFAFMALLTHLRGGDVDLICSAAHAASPLGGMVPMYVLMSAFHLAPWLKLVARRRRAASWTSRMARRRAFARLPQSARMVANGGQIAGHRMFALKASA